MQKAAYMAMVASYIAESLVTTAMGMVVAIAAVWCRNYLIERTENFESEMSNAELETITYLHAHPERRKQEGVSIEAAEFSAHGLLVCPLARRWEAPYDRQRILLAPVSLSMAFIVFVLTVTVFQSYLYWR
jgi:hypothetical protein